MFLEIEQVKGLSLPFCFKSSSLKDKMSSVDEEQ